MARLVLIIGTVNSDPSESQYKLQQQEQVKARQQQFIAFGRERAGNGDPNTEPAVIHRRRVARTSTQETHPHHQPCH